jgi:hypothetical protein
LITCEEVSAHYPPIFIDLGQQPLDAAGKAIGPQLETRASGAMRTARAAVVMSALGLERTFCAAEQVPRGGENFVR